ncbi:MAG: hypothetical protein U5N56_05445 [Candidatus Marinimicrobia bacterium]|nr:hypothetical protein [Candidatus Neomarinimicrobiota bacterium]
MKLNREIMNNFTVTHAHHFGMGLHVPKLPLHFYFGYQYLPDAYQGLNGFSLATLSPRTCGPFSFLFQLGRNPFPKTGDQSDRFI